MGIKLDSTLCPRCSEAIESVDHALFSCMTVHNVWNVVAKWWNMDIGNINSVIDLLDSATEENKRWLREEVIWDFIYLIWSHRNRVVFERYERKWEYHFFEFQRKSFE